jgi:hypothetical protein
MFFLGVADGANTGACHIARRITRNLLRCQGASRRPKLGALRTEGTYLDVPHRNFSACPSRSFWARRQSSE